MSFVSSLNCNFCTFVGCSLHRLPCHRATPVVNRVRVGINTEQFYLFSDTNTELMET